MGSLLAVYYHSFQPSIMIWAMLTTLFLQILSNLANDYGDTVHGVDNQDRIGPKRSLQKGEITLRQMGIAIFICIVLALISGISLIIHSMRSMEFSYSVVFFLIGIAAIVAAVKYTIGSNPYGYSGLGDFFVFIFFGIVGVIGTYFLHTHRLSTLEILPAITIGCFSAGVLNLNNLRDRVNDAASGKNTLVVKIGLENAKYYHAILLTVGKSTFTLVLLPFQSLTKLSTSTKDDILSKQSKVNSFLLDCGTNGFTNSTFLESLLKTPCSMAILKVLSDGSL